MLRLFRFLVAVIATGLLAGCVAPTPGPPTVFADDFNGTHLDLSRWEPNWLAGNDTAVTKPVNGDELSCYDPHNVTVSDGALHLRAEHRACAASNGTTYPYASGLVNTARSFSFQTGTITVRAYVAGTHGTIFNWPAIWTNGRTWPVDGENDTFEGLAGRACYTTHTAAGSHHGCAAGDFTGWHTFAATLTNDTVTYAYDGHRLATFPYPHRPQFAVLNLGVGGYGGPVVAPSELRVDYVRVTR